MKNGAELTVRAREMFAVIARYRGSGLTQKAFCQQEGIAHTTLQYWLRRYRAHHALTPMGGVALAEHGGEVASFMPIGISSRSAVGGRELRCIIEYPNGVVLHLNGEFDLHLLRELAGGGEGLEIDNNLVENAIRPVALGRKNYLFAGSHEGAKRAALVYSLAATARLHEVEPFEYFKDVIGCIADYPYKQISDLLPANWKSLP